MKSIATTTLALLASAMLTVSCKNSERSSTTDEGTTIEDDANGNVGNSDVTTSPGTNVDQTTPNSTGTSGTGTGTGTGTTGTASDTIATSEQQSTNSTNTGGQR